MGLRRSCGPPPQWEFIVMSWVNLFDEDPSLQLSTIKTSTFFMEAITTIFKFYGIEDVSFASNDDLAGKFVKEFYPEIIKEKRFNMKNEDDILILVSLLMYTTCVKCKIQDFVEKTCTIKLDDNNQEAMKNFFELMLNIEDGIYTRRNIMDAIQQCFGPVATTSDRKSFSSQQNCEKTNTTLDCQIGSLKEVRDVRNFNALLQEENLDLWAENDTLSKKIQELEASVKRLQTNLSGKSQEIASLREELWHYSNRPTNLTSMHNGLSEKNERKLNEEMCQLKTVFKQALEENYNLLKKSEAYMKQNSDLEIVLNKRELELIEIIKLMDIQEQKLQTCEATNMTLENTVKELRQIIEMYEEEKCPHEEINMSAPRDEENLGLVLRNLELLEKEEEIEHLHNQQQSLERLCKEKHDKIKEMSAKNVALEKELALLKTKLEDQKCTQQENTLQLELKDKKLAKELKVLQEMSAPDGLYKSRKSYDQLGHPVVVTKARRGCRRWRRKNLLC